MASTTCAWAVRARLEDGRLRVLEGRCPNLLTEAGMYRWGEAEDRRAEVPVDKDNHALAALRYLIATIDRHSFPKRGRKSMPPVEEPVKTAEEERERRYAEMADSEAAGIWWRMAGSGGAPE